MEPQIMMDGMLLSDGSSSFTHTISFVTKVIPILNVVFLIGLGALLVWFFRTFKANHEILKRIEEKMDRLSHK